MSAGHQPELLPELIGGERNWQGKLLALAATALMSSQVS